MLRLALVKLRFARLLIRHVDASAGYEELPVVFAVAEDVALVAQPADRTVGPNRSLSRDNGGNIFQTLES